MIAFKQNGQKHSFGSVLLKKLFLENSQNSQENTCTRASFLINLQAQVFSCDFCEISKNTFPYRTPPVAVSKFILIKSFLTEALYDRLKFVYRYLNTGDKVPECYNCFKLMIHAYLHVVF